MENNTLSSYGTSILVPCVQELAKENLITIPPRYVRSHQHDQLQIVSSDPQPCLQIPVIDLETLLSDVSMDSHSEFAKLHEACTDWGFFQLVNHGVSTSLIEKMKEETQEFFKLPIEEKKKLWQNEVEVEGFGQAFVVSEEQKLDWSDIFFLSTSPVHLRKPHLFPNLPLPFRNTLDIYSKEVKKLAMTVLTQLEKALGIKDGEITEIFRDGYQSMRMNYYPPCPEPEKVIGLTPHSDSVGLTILLQINEVEGLKIKKNEMWVPVIPFPNAFIINIGDILEIITNGKYKSIEHCATVNSERERLSIAAFHNPSHDKEIRPVSSLISHQNPALFKSVKCEEYVRALFTRELDGKSYLDFMRINSPSLDEERDGQGEG